MTDRFSEEEAIAAIPGLTRGRLIAFVEAAVVMPQQADTGLVFRRVDIARLALLCDLSDDLALDEEALALVISLIDQLHDVRQNLHAVMRAVSAEPAEVRTRIGTSLRHLRG